jgi:hypothetical protein
MIEGGGEECRVIVGRRTAGGSLTLIPRMLA